MKLLIVLLLLSIVSADDDGFLWRINSSPPSYVFGTIHVPYSRVWDAIPQNAKTAFLRADRVYFELNMHSPQTMARLAQCQLLPKGQHLSQLVPSELYLRLRHHLDVVQRQMVSWSNDEYLFQAMTANWERKRPIWVVLMVNTLTRNDVASRGVPVLDLYLNTLARKAGKEVGAIESVSEQCDPLNNLSLDKAVYALNETLKYFERKRLGESEDYADQPSTDDLIEQYRLGNLNSDYFAQDTFGIPTTNNNKNSSVADEIDEYFNEHLIRKRNRKMASRVINLLVNQPSRYFFAFGAGHFVGETNNVLRFIRSAGFTVDRISPDQRLISSNRIQGSFDDLSEDEKLRAYLQLLHHKQQLDNNNHIKKKMSKLNETEAAEESLKIWYGYDEEDEETASVANKPSYVPQLLLLLWLFTLFR